MGARRLPSGYLLLWCRSCPGTRNERNTRSEVAVVQLKLSWLKFEWNWLPQQWWRRFSIDNESCLAYCFSAFLRLLWDTKNPSSTSPLLFPFSLWVLPTVGLFAGKIKNLHQYTHHGERECVSGVYDSRVNFGVLLFASVFREPLNSAYGFSIVVLRCFAPAWFSVIHAEHIFISSSFDYFDSPWDGLPLFLICGKGLLPWFY